MTFRLTAILKSWFADGLLGRIFKNAGLLLTGRAASGLFMLGTLSIMAHKLGVEQFGIVVLVQTYVLVVSGLATFQSWQAVIRYGAIHLERGNDAGLHSLLRFTTMLDVLGVVIGTIIGFAAVPWVGPALEWNPEVIAAAQPYSLLILFTVIATPTGLLRLFDRFDLLAVQSAITPATRLIGVAIAALADAPLWGYLLAWFVAGVLGGIALMFFGWAVAARSGHLAGMRWRGTIFRAPEPGIWRFVIAANLHSSLLLIPTQMATFLVGLVAGPAPAGLFKVARDVATALARPAEILNQSIYPEFAKLGSRGSWTGFAKLIVRGGALAGGAGVAMLALTIAVGEPFLRLAFGVEFVTAYAALVLLVGSAVITIAGFPMDPALYAMGRPGIPLRVNAITVCLVFAPLLLYLGERDGPAGAGVAALSAAAVGFLAMAAYTVIELRKRAAEPSA
ncbi:MAG: oligosaccharide flippase family protein [Rhodobacteraceae bacterium]|nr:oligosaccharide flippase family protein [Paracoccaceae bacterium]